MVSLLQGRPDFGHQDGRPFGLAPQPAELANGAQQQRDGAA